MKYNVVRRHQDLQVYKLAFSAAMEIFAQTKKFPKEEKFSLISQILRSSRSVCSNITEAWRRRRYLGEFLLRLNFAEGEAAETQTWLDFCLACQYIDPQVHADLSQKYDFILGKLVRMINEPKKWLLPKPRL